MTNYIRKISILGGIATLVAVVALMIPFSVINDITGISFELFFLLASAVEFVCAMAIVYVVLKYRDVQEEKQSEWRYDPE